MLRCIITLNLGPQIIQGMNNMDTAKPLRNRLHQDRRYGAGKISLVNQLKGRCC